MGVAWALGVADAAAAQSASAPSAPASAPAPGAGQPEPITVAVLEMRAKGADLDLAGALLDVVSQEVGNTAGHKALSRKEVESILSEEARKQLSGCSDTSCLAELGDALNAQMLVSGELAKVGETMLLTLQLINHRYATVMNRVALNWPGNRDQLPQVARVATQMLMLTRTQKKPGQLEVVGAPSGARIYVDEELLKGRVLGRVDMGVHSVRVVAGGYEDHEVVVLVGNGEKVRVNGSLSAIPLYRRPWFWGGGLALSAGAAVFTAAVVGLVPVTLLVFATGRAGVQARSNAPRTGSFP